MRRALRLLAGVAAPIAICSIAPGADFQWFDYPISAAWTVCDNWKFDGLPEECYPSSDEDDVRILARDPSQSWTIAVANVTIDDLLIKESVVFGGAASIGGCLVADSVTVDANDRETDLVIVIDGDGITHHADDCPN
ncbi:MAG: hypothetical protein AB7Q17_06390 [Phycisphaerae bacterium]